MIDRLDRLWYKDAVIYQLHVKAFADSDNDGVGDFVGLRGRLDYIQDLGVTAVWLLPFYPSPLRDDGYDIADYRGVHPLYGTLRDVRALIKECHRRDLRVITELVINHTSDQHPWFQRARHAKPGSPSRDYYVWSDSDQRYQGTRIIFCDSETSNWTWDAVAGQYYWHRFYSHQPDLNFENPRVLRTMINVMRFWLDLGVDGLRLDAIPYLREREGTSNENLPETHEVLKAFRAELDRDYAGRMLLAEANQWPEDVLPYFGDPAKGGDECHMAFHFPLMPRLYMAVAQEDRHPIADILRQTPEIPENCQWAIFLRNHDELTLEMVTSDERDYLWNTYAADRRMRINLGIRRRLAPLLENDRRKIELLNSLLLSMPGTPVLYYGDEIGMGDNIYLGDRDGVRTPMQWSPDRNGGFSRADPARLYLPANQDPIYGYAAINVEAQSRNQTSLLNVMRRLIAVRRQRRVFGRGGFRPLSPGNRKVLAYLREDGGSEAGETVLCVANLSRAAQAVELDLAAFKGRVPVELSGRAAFPPIGEHPYLLTLPAYGFHWFLLAVEAELPRWHEPAPEPPPDLLTLVARAGWASILQGRARATLEGEALPAFFVRQRWFASTSASTPAPPAARLAFAARLPGPGDGFLLAAVDVGDGQERLFVPLAMNWGREAGALGSPRWPYTLARIRAGAQLGALVDATRADGFAPALLGALAAGLTLGAEGGDGVARFLPTAAMIALDTLAGGEVRRLPTEGRDTLLLVAETVVVKLLRPLAVGPHPELEIGRRLTEVVGFPHAPPLLGVVEWAGADGEATALAFVQGFARNQGDGWVSTVEYLERALDEIRLGAEDGGGGDAAVPASPFARYGQWAALLGRRTAELHRALVGVGDDAFSPELVGAEDIDAWRAGAARRAEAALAALEGAAGEEVQALRSAGRQLVEEAVNLDIRPRGLFKTRIHGDYRLGKILRVQNDVAIINFEGAAGRPLAERRAKRPALADVASMLWSFDQAARAAMLRLAEKGETSGGGVLEAAAAWRRESATAFLDAYRQDIAGSPCWPEDGTVVHRILRFYLIEAALSELAENAARRAPGLAGTARAVLALVAEGGTDGLAG